MFPSVSQLDSFTDVFGDEAVDENVSQPLSLPTTCDTPRSLTNGSATITEKTVRPLKHTGQHGEFRSVEEIDPKYRCLFTYPYFNLVQSRIIEDALYSDASLVVCAPTGSGKTVVFELAILQLLMHMEDHRTTQDYKIIYMAPVKAVCSERLAEWYPKLTRLGLLCIEVTGDTEVDFTQLAPYRIIITTPEKWDMLTRRWRDHRGLVETIKLFLIDEVHILNDETRGPVLEAVVSRMKTVESAAQSAHRIEQLQQQYRGGSGSEPRGAPAPPPPPPPPPPRIRFVAASATVGNPEDVADWLGTSEKPAVFHKFGDECRPVKLQRIVEGYPCAEGTSIFKFDLILNYKLWPIIQKYYNGKPTLIFCNTRKSVALTAEALSREVTVSFSPEQKAKLNALASTLKNKKLQMLVMSGVGCHHAGLLYEERVNIERAFRNRDLPILITTTTLAMGVNLPAHLVIVKNTQQYVNGAYQEYSISTVLQMVGRAGRPQFDTHATAVIMTRTHDKARYQALVGGSEPLQSYLHKRLAENLNSEAALGTVADVAQCVQWLRSTFLYVRAARDPRRYLGLPPAAPAQLILKKLEELCVKAMNSLASSGLITMDEASCIESTEAGRLMSSFYMDVETMKNIMKIEGSETLERLLWLVCESRELSDMHLRMDERRCLNLLNRNNKAATIRFPMKGKISTRQMKLNCIIQATLGCLPIPEPSLNQEAMKVMRTASRVCKCLVRYVTRSELVGRQPAQFLGVLNALVLGKCVEAHLWEHSPYVSRQLRGIGAAFSTLLASAGVTSFLLLEETHPRDLERIMNKGPPAGNMIRKQVALLPKYQLTVTPIDSRSVTVQLMLLNHAHLSDNINQLTAGDCHKSYLLIGDSENNLILFTQFTDKDFIGVYDGTMRHEVTRKLSCEHKIFIHCVSSVIVGIDTQADYLFLDLEPQIPRDNHWSNSNISRKSDAGKQTAITDVYRERKRKINSDNDITQCKEKRKREYVLTQKIQALKESFGKTSKALKTDIHKSGTLSNKVIHDLLDGKSGADSPVNVKQVTIESPTVDLTKDVAVDPLEEIILNNDDDYIDDSQIDSILSKIESEISGNDHISKNMPSKHSHETKIPTMHRAHGTTRPIQDTEKVDLTYRNLNNTPHFVNESRRSAKDSKGHKNINMKTNYSFIDLIEKKEHTDDKDKTGDKTTDTGFSDAIKDQINRFLQQAQTRTKPTMPQIDELIQSLEDEELPEVHVKSAPTTDTNTNVKCDEQDNIDSNKSDHLRVACSNIESPGLQNDVNTEQDGFSNENNVFGENLDPAEVNINTESILETNQCIESLEETIDLDLSQCDEISNAIRHKSKIIEENKDLSEGIDTLPNTPLNMNWADNETKHNKRCEKFAPNYTITWDKNLPVDSVEALTTKPSDDDTKALMPFNHKVETKDIESDNNRERNYHFKSLIPCSTGRQSLFGPDNVIVDKLATPYPNDHQNIQNHIEKKYGTSSRNWDTSDQMLAIQSGATNLKLMRNNYLIQNNYTPGSFYCHSHTRPIVKRIEQLPDSKNMVEQVQENDHIENEHNTSSTNWATSHERGAIQPSVSTFTYNSIKNNCPPGNFTYSNPNVVNRIERLSDTKHMVAKDIPEEYNNKGETYFKRFSYTATKVDVCTKKYAPDHELRITRKLQVDVDITEVVKQDKANTNKSYKGDHYTEDVDNKSRNNEITNIREMITQKNTAISEGTKVITESNHTDNVDARKESLTSIEDKAEPLTANNNIEYVLKKYSRILAKPETQTPRTNITNKIIGNTTVGPKTDASVTKSRKPFKISEINAINATNVPLPDNLTNSRRSVPIARPIAVPTVKVIKEETIPQNLKLHEPSEINLISETSDHNDISYESPVSVRSLKLDQLEDIKDDSMFNPKLLLQHFTEGSQEVTDLIAPPAPFSDNTLVYSPTDQAEKIESYENPEFDTEYSDMETANFNNNTFDNSSNLEPSPNEMETWCFSRDDCDTYASSVPSSHCDTYASSVPSSHCDTYASSVPSSHCDTYASSVPSSHCDTYASSVPSSHCDTYASSVPSSHCDTYASSVPSSHCDTYASSVPSSHWSQRAYSSQVNTGLGSRRAKLGRFKFVRKKPFRP